MQTIEYQINSEKRTVTCIIKHPFLGVFVGKAKCKESDQWSEAVGKKLARKRALLKAEKHELEYLQYCQSLDELYRQIAECQKAIRRQEFLEDNIRSLKLEIEDMIVPF